MDEEARHAALAELYDLPGHLLWRANAKVTSEVGRLLPGTVDLHGYAALLSLAEEEPQSQRSLALMCGVSGTTMTSVAGDLERAGLVRRIRNPEDRRSYSLRRTPEGRAAVRRWAPHVEAIEDRLTSNLTERETTRLRTLLLAVIGDHLDGRTPPALLSSIGFLVTRTHQRLHREFLAGLAPLDIEPRHYGTLRTLRLSGPRTQGELAELLDVSPATVVQMVDHLERRGLLTRQRDPADRRAYRLHLLPEAETVIAAATRVSGDVLGPRVGAPGDRDREGLVRLLRKFLAGP